MSNLLNVIVIGVLLYAVGQKHVAPTEVQINRYHYEKNVTITRGHQIASFSYLGKQFAVSFDFTPSSFSTSWGNVFHMTTNKDCCDSGSRLPLVMFREQYGKNWLQVHFINGGKNTMYYKPRDDLKVGKKITIRVEQTLFGSHYVYALIVNGELLWAEYNDAPQEFAEVKIFCSNPWYNAQKGHMENLEITSN